MIQKVIIVPNPKKDGNLTVTKAVINKLASMGMLVYVAEKYAVYHVEEAVYYNSEPQDADMIIVVGGDGSVIDASPMAIRLGIPLLGVNLGKVGYLGEVDIDSLDILGKLADGKFGIEEKMLLQVEKTLINGDKEAFSRLAVNDVVVSHDDYFGIADFRVENGSGDKVKYRADGMIIATPIGSTAYSLSAGGPIISHSLDTISVTPVCPHSFFNRSIVFGSDEAITISNIGDAPLNISLDGRFCSTLAPEESCKVSRSEKRLKMIAFSGNNMFSVLFRKIKLLEDRG